VCLTLIPLVMWKRAKEGLGFPVAFVGGPGLDLSQCSLSRLIPSPGFPETLTAEASMVNWTG
jgi:hypothetical protein